MLTVVGEIRSNRNDRYYYYCYCELTVGQISRGEEVVGLIDGGVGIQPGRCVRAVMTQPVTMQSRTSVRNRTSPEKQNIK